MKRLLAQIGITAFSALAVAFYLPQTATLILLVSASAAAVLLLIIKKTRKTKFIPAIAITAAIAFAANLIFTVAAVIPVQERFSGDDRRVEAVLSDEPYMSYSQYCYRLKAVSVDGVKADARMLLKTREPINAEPYDIITFTADISPTDNDYYLSKGYYISVYTYDESIDATGKADKDLYYHAIKLRQAFRRAFDEYLPDDCAALCKTIFVGDKYSLDEEIKTDFRYAGASHFVIVSGMHFSVLCLLLLRLLKKLRTNRYLAFVLALIILFAYMAITGFQPSVVRSGVMMLMYLTADLMRRESYAHNSLGIAGLVLPFVFTPYGMGDIGLILSFGATFGVITWQAPIYNKLGIKEPNRLYKKALNLLIGLFSVSLAANIIVFPISVIFFGAVSSVTLISSVVIYLPVWLILALSLPFCILYCLGPLKCVSLFLSWPLYWLSRFVLFIVRSLAALPFSYVNVGKLYVYVWLGVSIALGIVVIAFRNDYKYLPAAVIISALVLIVGAAVTQVVKVNTVQLEVYGSGSGMAVGFHNRGEYYLLAFDSNLKDARSAMDDIKQRHDSAELAVCSVRHDYSNYSRFADKEFAISRYLLYDNSSAGLSDRFITVSDSYSCEVGEDAQLDIAAFKGRTMTYLDCGGTTVLLIPRSFSSDMIPAEYLQADIAIITEYRKGYEKLSCGQLIICDDRENADKAAAEMAGSYETVMVADSGVTMIDLR